MDKRVVIVDDDPTMLKLLEGFLTQAGYTVFSAANGVEALRVLHQEGPSIVITDWEMPLMNGLELCQAIRSSEVVGFVYTIILTAHADKTIEAFEAGADDFMSKPPRRGELLARLKAANRIIALEADLAKQNREIHKANAELAVLNGKLVQMATTDELTDLANRREAMQRLNEYWETASRHGQPLACILLDIDHFKRVNDAHGHDAGDVVLRETARVLARTTRAGEKVCRVGGEEFLVLCPNATAGMAAQGAERLRQAVESHTVRHKDLELAVTVSIGVAQREAGTGTPDDLLKNADDAMYVAKAAGRNTVRASGVDETVSEPRIDSCCTSPT